MATITDAKLVVTHDHEKKLVRPVVTCKVHFTDLEQCLMKTCARTRLFKLKCELWGEDSGLTGSDDKLWTYTPVKYYPDPTPTATESVTFVVMPDPPGVLGEGVLDEDGFLGGYVDEVYGKLTLTNLFSLVRITKKTNVVSHRF